MAEEAPVPPLAGLCVVEAASSLGATYAGFLLAGLGADVWRLEERDDPRWSPGERVLHRGKHPIDRPTTDAIAAGADVVLVDDAAPAMAAAPDAIRCRVSGWGDGDRGLPADEALVAALTGVQTLQWSWSGSPVWVTTPLIGYMSGLLGALGTTAALFARRRGAPGQAVTVSGPSAAFALNSGTYVMGSGHQGSLSQQGDPRGVYPNYSLYPTADGWLFVGALTQEFWVKLVTVLDRVDLLADPRLQGHPFTFGAAAIRAFVRGELDPIFRTRPTDEWTARLRAADIPCGPVRSRSDALRDAEARALGLVVRLDDPVLGETWQPGAVAVLSDTPAPAPCPAAGQRAEAVPPASPPAPRPPASQAPALPLAGVRVLDLTSFIAGPFCPMLLADLGADVVKVESAAGDPFRMAAFAFVGWNRGKRSLVLDLKRPEAHDVFLDLVRRADAVVDNFRAGVMERLGLGWETLRAANPRLVHTSITGFGGEGPLATLPGFDPVFQARTGLMHAQGGPTAPVFHMVAYNDYCAGTLGALATVAALLARERTGRGQRVDVSLFRTSYVVQAAHMILHEGRGADEVGGPDHLGPGACRRLYGCADGWLCVAATTAAAVVGLGRLAAHPVRADDPPDGRSAEAIAARLATLARQEALAALRAEGVPAAPCLGFAELFGDPLLRAAGTIVEQPHPTLGVLHVPGPFIGFERTPLALGRSAPILGADGAEVLREIGYPDARIAGLIESGVVGRPTG